MRMPDSLNLKPPKPAEDMGMPIEVKVMGLERDELPSHEQVEHMRFGLSASGPLSQAVLENNANALLFALPTGITLATGMVLLYAKTGTWAPPDGWLECDGAAVDAQRYPELREVVGANVPTITQLSSNLRYVVKT
jgi:hypothetical protein